VAVRTLFGALRRRGYSRQFLRTVAKEERAMGSRNQTIQRKILPLVVQFSRTAKGLASGVRRNFGRLTQDEMLGARYRTGQVIPLNQKDFVYLIKCSLCRKRYVGETGNSILTRMWGHKLRYFDEIREFFFYPETQHCANCVTE